MLYDQHPSAHFTYVQSTDPPNLIMKARNLDSCRRAIVYAAYESRPGVLPDRTSLIAEYCHQQLVPVAVESLRLDGWTAQTRPDQRPFSQGKLHHNLTVIGQTDLVASHPDLTQGQPALLTIETNQPAETAYQTHRKAAFLHWALNEEIHPIHPNPIMVNFDPNNMETNLSHLEQDKIPPLINLLRERLLTVSQAVSNRDEPNYLPDRDHSQYSKECQSCPWQASCRPNP